VSGRTTEVGILEPLARISQKPKAPQWLSRLAFPILFCLIGLMASYRLPVLSGLEWIPLGPEDGKLNHAFLEHSWLWVSGHPKHDNLWDAPFFYPLEEVMARGDLMASFAPPYWICRAVGCDPDVSVFVWLLTMCAINFFLVALSLRRFVGVALLPSAIGAYLFCFAAVRIGNVAHIQLLPHCYVLGSVLCAATYVRNVLSTGNAWAGRGWVLAAAVLLTIQLYGSFYLLLFYGLAYIVGILAGVFFRSGRRFFTCALRRDSCALFLTGIAVLVLAWPAYMHYSQVAEKEGPSLRKYSATNGWEVADLIAPTARSWLHVKILPNRRDVFEDTRTSINLGWVTSIAIMVGMLLLLRKPTPRYFLISFFLTAMLGFTIAGYSLWGFVYSNIPGASAIRATFRIALLLQLPAAMAFALAVDWGLARRGVWRVAAVFIVACMAIEQVPATYVTNRHSFNQAVRQIISSIPPDCESFFLTGGQGRQLAQAELAIWAAFNSNVPTVNGRTGKMPNGYKFLVDRRPAHRPAFSTRKRLHQWLEFCGRSDGRIAIIRINAKTWVLTIRPLSPDNRATALRKRRLPIPALRHPAWLYGKWALRQDSRSLSASP